MILLLTEHGDSSAFKFMKLCDLREVEYFNIEDKHDVTFDNIQIKNGILNDFTIINKTLGKFITKEMITGFFYRKGQLTPHLQLNLYSHVNISVGEDLCRCLTDEWEALVFYVFDWIEHNVPSVGRYNNNIPNKLKMLNIASRCGFKVPDSYIYSNSKAITTLAKSMPCVTKSIQDILIFEHKNEIYGTYTSNVEETLQNNESVFPSLIQKRINSQYEIRVFYFANHIYSIAITHDKINNVKVDYRNSQTFPDVYPYHLTAQDEKKFRKFMQYCGYNSGSVDFLLSDDGELVFLEINPIGQFDFVSDFCGKNIEIDILNFFVNHDSSH